MVRELMLLSLLATSAAAAQDAAEDQQGPQGGEQQTQSDSRRQLPQDGGQTAAEQQDSGGVKTLPGMSILGNEEAPKSLVIVPWKSSEVGDGIGVTNALDERARPVDKEVFMRELHYYELRSGR